MARDTAYFVTAIRQLSNTENDPVVTDPEIIDRASEAKAALYDKIIATYEHYAVKTTQFTLAGGVGKNAAPLPTDFYKDISLTRDPGTTFPKTIHRMSSWVDRNDQARLGYMLLGSQLWLAPPTMSAGNYELAYTPLDEPFALPVTATVAYPTSIIPTTGGSNAVDTSLSLANWFFSLGAFDSSAIGKMLGITGAVNAGNNGLFLVQALASATTLRTSKVGLSDEAFGPGLVAALYTGPFDSVDFGGANIFTFNGVDFTGQEVGDQITIAGSRTADGTYTIAFVDDAHTVNTDGPPLFETFAPGVTVTYQPAGTVNVLPQIFAPWYEYIQVHAAIAVKDKIEQDTADLQVRLGKLEQRIEAMAANRMEEGGQIAMPRLTTFWDDDFYPGG